MVQKSTTKVPYGSEKFRRNEEVPSFGKGKGVANESKTSDSQLDDNEFGCKEGSFSGYSSVVREELLLRREIAIFDSREPKTL